MTKIVTCKLTQVDLDKGMVRIPKEFSHLIKKNENGKIEVHFNGSSKEMVYDKWNRIGYAKEWFKDLKPQTLLHISRRNGAYEFKVEEFLQEKYDQKEYKDILKRLFVKDRNVFSFSVIRMYWQDYLGATSITPDDLINFMQREHSISIRYFNIKAVGAVLKKESWKIFRWLRWILEVAIIPIVITLIQII